MSTKPHAAAEVQGDWSGELHSRELNMMLGQKEITLKKTLLRHRQTNVMSEHSNSMIMTIRRII